MENSYSFIHPSATIEDSIIGDRTKIWNYAQIREKSVIGRECIISKNVYIDHSVKIGNRVKIQNNVSIYFDAEIEDGVFIGPHVCFTNDKNPRAVNSDGTLKTAAINCGTSKGDWHAEKTIIKEGASIGANSTLLPGITIGRWALVGAGSVVTKDVPDYALVIGNPAKVVGKVCKCGKKMSEPHCSVCKFGVSNRDNHNIHNISIAKPIIRNEEKEAVQKVLDSGMLVQGEKVKRLEEEFAKLCGTRYAITTNSGTSALHTSLFSIGIKPGDEVITTPFSFVATANSILMQNATPIFVDIEEDSLNIDATKIEEKITSKTKAILVVNIYGRCANYTSLRKIADKHKLVIIEDACQSVNAKFDNKKSGSLGDIAAFSLYATKNITSGEGGIITTNNEEYAKRARMFRFHGQPEPGKYLYQSIGYNYRMMDIQAAIALEQLKKLNSFTDKRIENARLLSEGLKNIPGIILPKISLDDKHVFHQYTIRVRNFKLKRNELVGLLKSKGIGCNIFYPFPLHLQTHFRKFGYEKGNFPITEKTCEEVLSLPVHPLVTKDDINRIIEVIKNA